MEEGKCGNERSKYMYERWHTTSSSLLGLTYQQDCT